MIYLDTSGFSYNDWVGNFYPLDMPKREWLSYYVREFNTCEINSTFYALPKPSDLKAMAEITSKVGYIRLHGCNNAKWWEHEQAYERYDYSYTPQELNEWLPKIRKLDNVAERTFIFANNHWRGQAVSTIRQLRVMLD